MNDPTTKWLLSAILILLSAACAGGEVAGIPALPTTEKPTALASVEPASAVFLNPQPDTASASRAPGSETLPTPEATLAFFDPPRPTEVSVEHITSFGLLPDNTATGEPAPDFSARLMGGGTFVLSDHRGEYWLVLPTANGCGECLYSLNLLGQAYPGEESNLNVLVLDIYQPDQPEYWEGIANYFGNPPYTWSVLDTPTFLQDYAIPGLGSFLVIDAQGRLVFRSDSAPRLEYIAHLFRLARDEGAK